MTPCHQLARDLKAAIDARMLGKQVQSVGHKGRSLSYSDQPLPALIAYYNQIRQSCADAMSDPELIEVRPLDQPTTRRGRPARFTGRGYV